MDSRRHNRSKPRDTKIRIVADQKEKYWQAHLRNVVDNFLSSNLTEIQLPGLPSDHRKYLHQYVRHLGLQSSSTGDKSNRTLKLSRIVKNSMIKKRILKLNLSVRNVLQEQWPLLKLNLEIGNQEKPRNLTRYSNSDRHSEFLPFGVGPIIVPSKPLHISPELRNEKRDLPIYKYADEILKMLDAHKVFIINGETGSGKSTQVPQYILENAFNRNRKCRIIVSQPRRVAAVTVSQRVATERGEELGDTVGFQIRMDSRLCKKTSLIYTTSGCLQRALMTHSDRFYQKITHLIIDEIHERDKSTDFTLISLKEQLEKNKNLKVILMSATMDIPLLSKYFFDCPVLFVPGTSYDVKHYYLEDILHCTGYRTSLMSKYLRSMDPIEQIYTPTMNDAATLISHESADVVLNEICSNKKSKEEICELFDQLWYYIESEGMPVDVRQTATGYTPLIAACKYNCPIYVENFVKQKANMEIRNAEGFSAYDYAQLNEDPTCLNILKNAITFAQNNIKTNIDVEKERLLTAYHNQIYDDNEVDHDLIISLIEGLYRNGHEGAIMVFLPGYSDIQQQRDLILSTLPPDKIRLCVLHGQMDSHDQMEAMRYSHLRKIVLSTNIGQTSITMPDLVYIIDSGKIKMNTYDAISNCSQLSSVWISQADANQRAGRAGRTQNGICYRLYSSQKFNTLSEFCVPEFMRIALTEICLYAKTLDKNCSIQAYLSRALNPPSNISIQASIKKLQILEAIGDDESVTELGKCLVDIPLDVQLGKCLLYSLFFKCFDSMLTIAAYHSIKDPFMLPKERNLQGPASFMRKSLSGDSFSDQLGILALYKAYSEVRTNKRRLREFCNKYFLSVFSMDLFHMARCQILRTLSIKFRINEQHSIYSDDWNMLRLCLTAGLYPNLIYVNRENGKLMSTTEKILNFQRSSALNPPGKKHLKEFIEDLPSDWIVFFEKSRVQRMVKINMNTAIPSIIVVLICGRFCKIHTILKNDDDDDDSGSEASLSSDDEMNETDNDDCDDDDIHNINESIKLLGTDPQNLQKLSFSDNCQSIFSIDDIEFKMNSIDAIMIKSLRLLIHKKFELFLVRLHAGFQTAAPMQVQRLLATSEGVQSISRMIRNIDPNYISETRNNEHKSYTNYD